MSKEQLYRQIIEEELGGYKTVYIGTAHEVVNSQFIYKSQIDRIVQRLCEPIPADNKGEVEAIGVNADESSVVSLPSTAGNSVGQETNEFLRACDAERFKFCHAINSQEWNTEMRTAAENILIMYDQLRYRLFSTTVTMHILATIAPTPSDNENCVCVNPATCPNWNYHLGKCTYTPTIALDSATPSPSVQKVTAEGWISVETKPKVGIEVIGYNPEWISEYNPNGQRICFIDCFDVWTSAKYCNYQDTYENKVNSAPVKWMPLPEPPAALSQYK